jgi:hypothetical protein
MESSRLDRINDGQNILKEGGISDKKILEPQGGNDLYYPAGWKCGVYDVVPISLKNSQRRLPEPISLHRDRWFRYGIGSIRA